MLNRVNTLARMLSGSSHISTASTSLGTHDRNFRIRTMVDLSHSPHVIDPETDWKTINATWDRVRSQWSIVGYEHSHELRVDTFGDRVKRLFFITNSQNDNNVVAGPVDVQRFFPGKDTKSLVTHLRNMVDNVDDGSGAILHFRSPIVLDALSKRNIEDQKLEKSLDSLAYFYKFLDARELVRLTQICTSTESDMLTVPISREDANWIIEIAHTKRITYKELVKYHPELIPNLNSNIERKIDSQRFNIANKVSGIRRGGSESWYREIDKDISALRKKMKSESYSFIDANAIRTGKTDHIGRTVSA